MFCIKMLKNHVLFFILLIVGVTIAEERKSVIKKLRNNVEIEGELWQLSISKTTAEVYRGIPYAQAPNKLNRFKVHPFIIHLLLIVFASCGKV